MTKQEADYLKPALENKVSSVGDRCFFIAESLEDLTDMLNRLKGLYDNYGELRNMVDYHCSVLGSLNPFRDSVRQSVGSER